MMKFAIGLFFICITIIIVIKYWRIFVPIIIAIVILGGLFLAAISGAFKAPPPPTPEQSAQITANACRATPRPSSVTDAQCEAMARQEEERKAKAATALAEFEAAAKAEQERREAAARAEQERRETAAKIDQQRRDAEAAERQRQKQLQALRQAFSQTPAGDYAFRRIQAGEQEVFLAQSMAPLSGAQGQQNHQAAVQRLHQAKADMEALWEHYANSNWDRNSICFINIAASQSHACHPEWGHNVASGTASAPAISSYKPETHERPTHWDDATAGSPYAIGGAWNRAIKAAPRP